MSYFRELAEEGPVIGCVCIWLAGVLFWFSHVVYVAIPHVIICLCLGKEIEQIKKKTPKGHSTNIYNMPASVSIQTLWADTFLHWIPSVPDTDISCDIGPQKLSFEPHWAWVVLEHEPLRSSSSLRSRRVTGKVSVPKRGAKCSSVAMYLYMISSVHRLPRSTVCCWKDRTKSLNTRWILSLVRKLSLEMCLAKDLGTQSRKLKKKEV